MLKDLNISPFNVLAFSLVGMLGHPIYWVVWTYLFPQPYDLYPLRFTASILCSMFLFRKYWPKFLERNFTLIWLIAITYILPFIFTLHLIINDFSTIWLMCEVGMLFIVAIFIPNFFLMTLSIVIGAALSVLFCYFCAISINLESIKYEHMIVLSFAYVAGFIFSYSSIYGARSSERADIFKSLAGSIAHELRNPLNAISLAGKSLHSIMSPKFQSSAKSVKLEMKEIEEVFELFEKINNSVKNADNIISIILGDLSNKSINIVNVKPLKISDALRNIVEEFGYKSFEEKNRVKTIIEQESLETKVQIDLDRFNFIIYNLLKNSLYYSSQKPNMEIKVGIEEREGRTCVYVYDTGPGISQDNIPKLFNDFFTSGKTSGTGLGLSFCKRNMKMFGGDIICESELGKWTKFSLLFPKINSDDIKYSRNKKILMVDDAQINLKIYKKKIESKLENITCETINDTVKALKLIKRNKYDLILTDFEMPVLNGSQFSSKLRKYDKDVPVIIFSSLRYREFLEELNKEEKYFSQYLRKDTSANILLRSIAKWMFDYVDNLSYICDEKSYKSCFKNKKILIVDDDEINRKLCKRMFEKLGAKVFEEKDGDRLINFYLKNICDNQKGKIDLIITDINMQNINGNVAAEQIRVMEKKAKINHSQRVPIIALTGDSNETHLKKYLDSKMTDYFVKGGNPDDLAKIAAVYLSSPFR